jgi:hypothetical protein
MTTDQWLRYAMYGLLWCQHEQDGQWRERFYQMDALAREMAREVSALKVEADTWRPLGYRGVGKGRA